METHFNGLPDQEGLGNLPDANHILAQENNPLESVPQQEDVAPRERHRHHEDHHVNRKYRMFSNHSSAGDQPHTSTSF